MTEIITKHLEPKKGGGKLDLADVTKMVGDKLTEILCSKSGVWQ